MVYFFAAINPGLVVAEGVVIVELGLLTPKAYFLPWASVVRRLNLLMWKLSFRI